ncbi:hypothetical protein TNCV_4844421 [Trichonephila clavipes]|uniref:Uncharacterized protein n=1 Tax=Trichonephila clavipes TaxID=2585209 RepID=A0A8X6WJT8_TRICX|nr:hypothetical protein TNCV_4844421 [Trichonephila clavipes]
MQHKDLQKLWTCIGDKISLFILRKVISSSLSITKCIFNGSYPMSISTEMNWLTSFAKEGSDHRVPSTSELTYLELFWKQNAQNKEKWLKPFHKWFKDKRPGLSLSLPCDS